MPQGYRFINERVSGGTVSAIIDDIKDKYSQDVVVELLDNLKIWVLNTQQI
jgi:hypothetical protein